MPTEDYSKFLFERIKDLDYASGYLTEVLANETQEAFLIALRDVIEARGENFSLLSEKGRLSLSQSGNMHLITIKEVLDSLGLQFTIARKEAT